MERGLSPLGPLGWSPSCYEQGSIPESSHSHTFVSFHNARFIRGDLPNKAIVSHVSYTQKG